jgi:hypothetical protein
VLSAVQQAARKEMSSVGESRHSKAKLGNIIPTETMLLISDVFFCFIWNEITSSRQKLRETLTRLY